jgi:hypothetical protein
MQSKPLVLPVRVAVVNVQVSVIGPADGTQATLQVIEGLSLIGGADGAGVSTAGGHTNLLQTSLMGVDVTVKRVRVF